jgi:hypothetical protein
LTIDEVEDVWATLTFAEKVGDSKSIGICLELLNQFVPFSILSILKHIFD